MGGRMLNRTGERRTAGTRDVGVMSRSLYNQRPGGALFVAAPGRACPRRKRHVVSGGSAVHLLCCMLRPGFSLLAAVKSS
jgi:hypothetical protein